MTASPRSLAVCFFEYIRRFRSYLVYDSSLRSWKQSNHSYKPGIKTRLPLNLRHRSENASELDWHAARYILLHSDDMKACPHFRQAISEFGKYIRHMDSKDVGRSVRQPHDAYQFRLYKTIIAVLAHNQHYVEFILTPIDGHSHLENLMYIMQCDSQARHPDVLDALSSLWNRYRADGAKASVLLIVRIVSALNNVLLAFCGHRDNIMLQTSLHLYLDMYRRVSRSVQGVLCRTHEKLLSRATAAGCSAAYENIESDGIYIDPDDGTVDAAMPDDCEAQQDVYWEKIEVADDLNNYHKS